MEVILENVRSLAGRHVLPISPLTVLTGENSSGKTTFLAMYSALTSPGYPLDTKFNEAPFDLGSFDTIATYKGGKYGRAKTFSLGFQDGELKVLAVYEEKAGQILLKRLTAKNEKVKIKIQVLEGRSEGTVEFKNGRKTVKTFTLSQDMSLESLRSGLFDLIYSAIVGEHPTKMTDKKRSLLMSALDLQQAINPGSSIAISPTRTKPRRTYDQTSDAFSPEGDHIPSVLARILTEADSKQKRAILSAIETFGRSSGLFRELKIRKFRRRFTFPFQLLVKGLGTPATIQDVGYGVSQSLPVLVQSVLGPPRTPLLLQQPEVHLHPRAQAALGSLFAELVGKGEKHLLVETHSDHLLDRIRQEVAAGTIRPEEVVVLFFEKLDVETRVHPIGFDEMGNVLNAPPAYRSFFLTEEMNLLRRTRKAKGK